MLDAVVTLRIAEADSPGACDAWRDLFGLWERVGDAVIDPTRSPAGNETSRAALAADARTRRTRQIGAAGAVLAAAARLRGHSQR